MSTSVELPALGSTFRRSAARPWLLFALLGCRSAAYLHAEHLDTEDAWRAVVSDRDNFGAEADTARERLDEKVWGNADRANTPLAYRRYLDEFPSGVHAEEAERRLHRLRRAESATDLADLDASEALGGPPGAADAALSSTSKGDPAALQAYLIHHPNSPRGDELRAREDDLSFGLASRGDAEALQHYLEQHPQGRHRPEVLDLLAAREVRALLWEERFLDAAERVASLKNASLRQTLGLELCRRQARATRASDAALADLGSEGLALVLPNDGAAAAVAHGLTAEEQVEVLEAVWTLADTGLPSSVDPLLGAMDPDRVVSVRWIAQLAVLRLARGWPAEVRELELQPRRVRIASRAASAPLWIEEAVLEEALGLDEAQVTLSKARHDAPDDPLPLALSLARPELRDPERSLLAEQLRSLMPNLGTGDPCAREWFERLISGGRQNAGGACPEGPVAASLAAQARRLAALKTLVKRAKTLSPALVAQLGRLAERDGSAEVRAAALASLAGKDTLATPECSVAGGLLESNK